MLHCENSLVSDRFLHIPVFKQSLFWEEHREILTLFQRRTHLSESFVACACSLVPLSQSISFRNSVATFLVCSSYWNKDKLLSTEEGVEIFSYIFLSLKGGRDGAEPHDIFITRCGRWCQLAAGSWRRWNEGKQSTGQFSLVYTFESVSELHITLFPSDRDCRM